MTGPQVAEPGADYFDVPASTYLRGSERLCCEHHQDRSGYSLVLSTPGGGSITQRFSDGNTLRQRQVALEHTLLAAGWVIERASA